MPSLSRQSLAIGGHQYFNLLSATFFTPAGSLRQVRRTVIGGDMIPRLRLPLIFALWILLSAFTDAERVFTIDVPSRWQLVKSDADSDGEIYRFEYQHGPGSVFSAVFVLLGSLEEPTLRDQVLKGMTKTKSRMTQLSSVTTDGASCLYAVSEDTRDRDLISYWLYCNVPSYASSREKPLFALQINFLRSYDARYQISRDFRSMMQSIRWSRNR